MGLGTVALVSNLFRFLSNYNALSCYCIDERC
jgi:hypothetical protein